MASVVRWIKHVDRKPQWFRKRKIDLAVLRQDILDYPDAYQYERAARLGVAQNAIFLALRKLGVTYKKTLPHPKADANARRIFQKKIAAYEAAGRLIVYIDESGFAHDAPRTHDYAPIARDVMARMTGTRKVVSTRLVL